MNLKMKIMHPIIYSIIYNNLLINHIIVIQKIIIFMNNLLIFLSLIHIILFVKPLLLNHIFYQFLKVKQIIIMFMLNP